MNDNSILLNGDKVSRIGFGCWQLAGEYNYKGHPTGYGSIDTVEAVKAIHMALDQGISFFDTAASYGYGRSEDVLGQALKSYAHKQAIRPVLCTKFSLIPGSNSDEPDYSTDNLIKNVELSLRRLQTDTLDIILLHNPPDDFDFSAYDTTVFDRLIAQGKIRHYGVSTRTVKGARHVAASGFGSVIEAVYNPLDRRYKEVFSNNDLYNKYTFICRVPLVSGFISPRTLIENRTFSENDIRNGLNKEQVEWVTASVRKLSFLNEFQGGIVVSALRFQLSNPYNTITIPGIKNTQQAADAILALELGPLPQDVLLRIENAVPEVFYRWV